MTAIIPTDILSPSGRALEFIQHNSLNYFLQQANPANGLTKDKTAARWPASITVTGLALACYPIAVEHGILSRDVAVERTLTTLRFLWNSPQGAHPHASGHKGFFYHFLDMDSGLRDGHCELSTIDSGFLFAGALAAAQYFVAESDREREIRTLSEALYLRADWRWAQNRGATLTHGWKPGRGFLKHRWQGYNEALLLYLLALGSPTHPVAESSYDAWTSSYEWGVHCGQEYLYSGPLFTHQLSHLWVDFRGIQDAFMRDKGIDYFENSRRATYAQQQYAIDNPHGFRGYSRTSWGLNASDGPGPKTLTLNGTKRKFLGYAGRGIPYGPDDGTLSPSAVIASLPFAPEIVLPAIGASQHSNSAHNPTYPTHVDSPGWISPWHYGLDQGPIALMIENSRSGFLWSLMRSCPHIVRGLHRAGFKGGWLS